METEQQKVLKLLEARKITADEAARLLDALGDNGHPTRARFLRVRVYDRATDKSKVNVTVPISLVRWGLQFVPESAQMKLNEHHVDFDQIAQALENDFQGKLVDVDNGNDSEKVEVFLE
jgi:hypothetical protein